jgi:hypothetical protein
VLLLKITAQAQKRPKKLDETLKKRSRNARVIGQRSVSMYSTINDGGVTNSQQVGEGLTQAWVCLPGVPKYKKVTR